MRRWLTWLPLLVLSLDAPAIAQQSVASFTLVNADSDSDIGPLASGATLDLASLPTRNLNVRANTSPATVGSVRFAYDGNANYRTESTAPYALAGDTSGNYAAWTPTIGSHTLTATPYTGSGATGTAGTPLTVTFSVVDGGAPPPPPSGQDGDGSVTISGEKKRWHKVTLSLAGKWASETGTPNPFLDYRMDVTFTNGSLTYVVPGYFAADGNAGETSAESGTTWRAHLCPDLTGTWTYTIHFKSGSNVAVNGGGSSVAPYDGKTGSFTVAETDKTGRDFRGQGRLQYVGKHHLRFKGSGAYFFKQGADSPENLFAYADFDGAFKSDGVSDDKIKTWSPHLGDWRSGDPVWKGTKGKGLIGALNYLAGKGMNAFSFLTMNIGGDDKNVFPYTTYSERVRMDCSRLDQWEVVFEHADRVGLYLHFKTQETENDQLLDGGELGTQRKLYYRELIARFAHHLALNWNLGEENTNTDAQRKAFAQFFYDNDPYRHNVVLHTFPGEQETVYRPMLGTASKLTGVSIQINWDAVHAETKQWVAESAAAGKPWVVANDEQGGANTGILPDASDYNHDGPRKETLWGNLMAGGAGCEYYFGYSYENSDLTCQDFRSRDHWWDLCRFAHQFLTGNGIPFWEMTNDNAKSTSSNDFCLYKADDTYLIYLKAGGTTGLDLSGCSGTFEVFWFDPRNGGSLMTTSIAAVSGGGTRSLGSAPNNTSLDWVILVRKAGTAVNQPPAVALTAPAGGAAFTAPATVAVEASASDTDGTVTKVDLYVNGLFHRTENTAPYQWSLDALPAGSYTLTAVAMDDDGASTTSASVTFTVAEPALQPPAAPSGLAAAAISTSQINLAWTDNSSNESGFKIERKTGPSGAWAQIAAVGAGVASYPDTGLASATTYYYRVRAYNSAGDSAYSNEAGATTLPPATGPEVVSLTLVNADTDADIGPLADGATLNLATLPTRNLNVRAGTSPATVGSVQFGYDGNAGYAVENSAPYALAGDTAGDYKPWTPAVGSHTLSATAWTSAGATGTAGATRSVSFTVVDAPAGTGTGLWAEYFDNPDFTGFALPRTDATVDFGWGTGSPDPSIGADSFSVRWSGAVEPAYSETYTFTTRSDDGVRLWVDGRLLIDNWTSHAPTENSGSIALQAGKPVAIRLDYYEDGGGSEIRLFWSSASQARQIVPQNRLHPWASRDVGAVAAAGGTSALDGSSFSVRGSGADIWNAADEFHFVYRLMTGDGEIRARVASVQNTNSWAKAGVMMRESLEPGARHAMVVVTPAQGVSFQRRTSPNGASYHTTQAGIVAPHWVRLVRQGDALSGYRSADGTAWTWMGTVSIALGSPVYVGLPVTSHSDGAVCTAQIDGVAQSVSAAPAGSLVTVTYVSTAKPYSLATAKAGALAYIDRSYTVTALSGGLTGGALVRTATDDKAVTTASHLTLRLGQESKVYVAYDKRATARPSWLDGAWSATAESLSTADGAASPMVVYLKTVPAGDLTLGGNHAGGDTGADANYLVVVQPAGAAKAVAASDPLSAFATATFVEGPMPPDAWIHEMDVDDDGAMDPDAEGDGLIDLLEPGYTLDATKVDTNGDGNSDESSILPDGRTAWETQMEALGIDTTGGGDAPVPAGGEDDGGARCGSIGIDLLLPLGFLWAWRRRRER